MGAQVKGVGVRAWNSFSSATRACLFIHVVSKRTNTFTLVLAIFLRAKEGLIFYFFFLFHKIFLPSLFPIPPYPTPFHHKKSNGRSLIASKQGLFLTQRAYDIYTTSFALINVDAISWHCIVDAILSQRLSARTLGRIC